MEVATYVKVFQDSKEERRGRTTMERVMGHSHQQIGLLIVELPISAIGMGHAKRSAVHEN